MQVEYVNPVLDRPFVQSVKSVCKNIKENKIPGYCGLVVAELCRECQIWTADTKIKIQAGEVLYRVPFDGRTSITAVLEAGYTRDGRFRRLNNEYILLADAGYEDE